MKTITISNVALSVSVTMLVGMATFAMVPLAHAQDFGDSYDSGCCDTGGDYTSYPDTSYTSYPDTSYTSYPDTSYDSYPNTTDYSTGYDTGSGYTLPYSSGYSYGGGYSLPYSTGYSTGYTNTNTNTNVNTNTCTTNSCNTTNNNNISNPAPIIYNPVITTGSSQPSYPVCDTCGCTGYQSCYTPQYVPSTPIYYQQPVAYNYPPSISLSAVPYTGLDLSPTEEAIYWTFLVLWCAVAAYLVVVKRVQVSIVRWLNATLFGSTTHTSVTKTVAKAHTVAPVQKTATVEKADAIDPFILSQVNR